MTAIAFGGIWQPGASKRLAPEEPKNGSPVVSSEILTSRDGYQIDGVKTS